MNLPDRQQSLESERRQRLAEVWSENRPSATETEAAWRRYQLRRTRWLGTSPSKWSIALAIAVLSGFAAAKLATRWAEEKDPQPRQPTTLQSEEAEAPLRTKAVSVGQTRPSAPEATSTAPAELAPSEATEAGSQADPTRGESSTPRRSIAQGQNSSSAAARRDATRLSPERTDNAKADPEPPSVGRFTEPTAWERAAAALRLKDKQAADRALADLNQSDDVAERHAAALARAQLWVSNGEAERARPVLQSLSRNGATQLIRQRASELLKRLP